MVGHDVGDLICLFVISGTSWKHWDWLVLFGLLLLVFSQQSTYYDSIFISILIYIYIDICIYYIQSIFIFMLTYLRNALTAALHLVPVLYRRIGIRLYLPGPSVGGVNLTWYFFPY